MPELGDTLAPEEFVKSFRRLERFRDRRPRRSGALVHLAATLAVHSLLAASPRIAAAVAVALDPTFGDGGTLTLSTSMDSSADEAFAVAVDGQGRILAAGYASNPRQQITCARFSPDGGLDETFAETGIVKLDIGVRARAQAIALQPDGKIVLAGFAVLVPNGIEQFVAVRLLDDGTPDPDFGDGGFVATSFGTRDSRALAVALQANGGIVLAGWARNSANRDIALVRYTSGGMLDPSFGIDGKATYAVGLSNDEATAVAIRGDGRIVFAGYAADGSTYDLLVGRLTAVGQPDDTFWGTGFRRVSASDGVEQANALLLQPDNRVVIVGQTKIGGIQHLALARINPTGVLDPTFNGSGIVTTAIGELAEARAIARSTRGRFLVAGRARLPGGKLQFVAARYLASGALDPTFGNGGSVLLSIGTKSDEGHAVAVQGDGAVVLAGTARTGNNADFGLARLLVDDCGDGFVDPGEQCDGGAAASCCSSSCTIQPLGAVCRAVADACDLEESCDGVSALCPPDDVLPDGDDDGVCDQHDLCPLDHDPLQHDGDQDGLGDACDPCTLGSMLDRTVVRFVGLATPGGDDVFRLTGSVTLPTAAPIDPIATGARVLVHAADGTLLFDVHLPAGRLTNRNKVGWRSTINKREYKFRSAAPVGGLVRRFRIVRAVLPGRYNLTIGGRDLDFSQLPLFGALRVTVVLDPPGAAVGRCGELTFTAPERDCALTEDQSALVCR